MLTVIIGFLASLLVQLLQKSPLPVFNAGQATVIRAFVTLVGIGTGVALAALEPGGLAKLDWNSLLTVAYNALTVIFAAAMTHYQFFRTLSLPKV